MIKDQLYSVIDGNASALKTYIDFKRMESELKEAMESIKDQAMEEARKYSSKSFVENGATIEIRNTAGKWSYNHVKEWSELNSKIEELQKQLQFASKAKASLLNEDTGEILQMARYTEGKETIFVTLNKNKN